MSQVGVVNTIEPPMLKDVTQPDLVKFDIDYVAYKNRISHINRSRNAANRITVATVKECIDPFLLNSLCILGEIEDATSLEEATDDTVKKWFDEKLEASPIDITERIRSAVSSVTYKHNKEDPAGGVESFILHIVAALDRNNASEIVQDKATCKDLIEKLIHKLEPIELRERVRDDRTSWKRENRANLPFFKKQVSKLAVQVHQWEVVRARINRSEKKRNRQQNVGKDPESNSTDTKRQKKVKNSSNGPKVSTNEGEKKRKEWNLPCINPDCPEKHRFKDCKNTPASERQALWDAWKEKRKNSKPKTMSSTKFDRSISLPNPEEGRYCVILEEKVGTTALGDTGSDESAMPKKLLDELLKSSPSIPIENMNPAAKISLAVKDSAAEQTLYTASKVVKVTITIVLPGSRLPLRLHGVPFFVVDQEMDEILLGRSFLTKIGFNLNEHLSKVSQAIDGKQFEHLNEEDIRLSATGYSGMQYNATQDDPVGLPEGFGASFGDDSPKEIDDAFDSMLAEAKANGLSEEGCDSLTKMLQEYRSVFRIKLGADSPADVVPLHIQLKNNPRPYRAPQRRYAPRQRNFIISTVQKLEKIGAIYKNPQSKWASPALAVFKPDSDEMRFTVDLRGPNAQTQPIVSAMPHLESMLTTVGGSKWFAKIDMAHAYWQIPLDKDSQEILSIQTPLGVYSSKRVLQGSTDAGNHFQAMTQESFSGIDDNKLQWMDDFLLHAKSEEAILNILRKFLAVCNAQGYKVHARKSHPFLKEARFCGRLISSQGIQFDPRNFRAISKIPKPRLGGELQQLLCATNWMRSAIPTYSKIIAPLHNLLEQVYKLKGSRKKRSISKHPLIDLWGAGHDEAFATLKQHILQSTKLSFPKKEFTVCLFTDASEKHWASVLTQVPSSEIKLQIEEQHHEPLGFLSGSFTGSSSRWSMPEKEGFAVIESMTRLDYITAGTTVSIFTDHATLVYLFDPIGQNPGIPRHTASKLMRWALKLSSFRYVIEHVAGERNVWADMLTRWAAPQNHSVSSLRVQAMILAPITPHLDEQFDWPNITDIRICQQQCKEHKPPRFKDIEGLFKDDNDVYWIPDTDKMMKVRIIVAGHAGRAGHRGIEATTQGIKKHFWWKLADQEIHSFVNSCLHCLLSATGDTVPRPLGHALHGNTPNEVIHFDYCYIMPGEEGLTYVLIIKDDFSGYVWLLPASNADATTTADGLLSWFASFGTVTQWISDQGSHFKNELVKEICDRLHSNHHFSLPYCPWSNGSVEVVCRELLKTLRAILSEFQLPQKLWPTVLPLVQSALNSTLLRRLGNRAPLTVFTGHPADNPLLSIKVQHKKNTVVRTIKEIDSARIMKVNELRSAVDLLHRDVSQKATSRREAEVMRHNAKTNVRPINFTVGDYVLRGILRKEKGRKPSVKWRGPYRVTDCVSEYVFVVEHLVTSKKEEVHGRRLKFFRNKDFEVTEEVQNHLAYQENELLIVKEFEDIKRSGECIEVLTVWRGFDKAESSWVDVAIMKEDVPDLLKDFIEDISKNGTPRQRKLAKSVLL